LYTNLSGEELERKVNDAWKDGVNYLNGQKVTGFSGATLRSSAYVASVKDAMDDAGLTDMALGLGFGVAAARNNLTVSNTKKFKTNFDAENPVSGKAWNNYFKEKYGAANVRWKDPIKSINEAIDMPSLLSGTNPEDIVEIAIREGWIVQPLKKGSKSGLLFSEGGGYSMNAPSGSSLYIQYHPGGGHHGQGAYYKVSSPKNGTIRINIEGGLLE
ncbi:hypothetical protein FQS08_00005, partial [Listeria innocua]|nr:hypothetical protein [Listeria innocua]